ncbi:hypothetical protein VTL71DRAFT_14593 [Oculimacula yallundae]|uniref:CBM1 domain-containing protein n=1 Tax=Oculimacula yallundae TaxID=86028 RepID=A0ABR4CJG8_9HELO
MQYTSSVLLTGASLLATVSAHGFLTAPAPRVAGDAMKAACGQQVFSNQKSDNGGNIQGELQVAKSQKDYDATKCNVWLCKGFQFADNAANIQSFTPGQVVPFKFDIRAPHAGVANVSIVDTATNSVIGSPLISFADFANNARPKADDQLSFSVTIPSDLGSKCSVAGACVIQHYWDARSIDQTYESCVDFTVGGSGSGSPAPAPAAGSTPAANTPAPGSADTLNTPETPASPISSKGAASPPVPKPTQSTPTTLATATKPTPTPGAGAPAAGAGGVAAAALYAQCGGQDFAGATTCVAGATCKDVNDYYSQCVPA